MADSKISNLPTATALDGTEVLPIIQGTTTKQATLNQVRELNILYKGRIYQTGTNAPVVEDYINPGGLTVFGSYGAVGFYSLQGFTGETFMTAGNYQIELSLTGLDNTKHVEITPVNETVLGLTTKVSGTLTDGVLLDVDGGGQREYQILTVTKY